MPSLHKDVAVPLRQPVALLISVSNSQRIPLLMEYRAHFAAVGFLLSPSAQSNESHASVCATCHRWRQAPNDGSNANVFCLCDDNYVAQSPHSHVIVAQQMENLVASSPHPVAGCAVAHMDMWVNIRSNFWHRPPLHAMWSLAGGLMSKWKWKTPICIRTSARHWGDPTIPGLLQFITPSHVTRGAAHPTWDAKTQTHNLFSLMLEKHVRLPPFTCAHQIQIPELRLPESGVGGAPARVIEAQNATSCCWGWTDFFYVPRFALSAFAALVVGPLREVFHEVAIPTAMNVLNTTADVPWETDLRCHGDCCHKRWAIINGDWPDAKRSLCGHRIDFTKATHREFLRQSIDPRCKFPTRRSIRNAALANCSAR